MRRRRLLRAQEAQEKLNVSRESLIAHASSADKLVTAALAQINALLDTHCPEAVKEALLQLRDRVEAAKARVLKTNQTAQPVKEGVYLRPLLFIQRVCCGLPN